MPVLLHRVWQHSPNGPALDCINIVVSLKLQSSVELPHPISALLSAQHSRAADTKCASPWRPNQTIVNSGVKRRYLLPARPNCVWVLSNLRCIKHTQLAHFYSLPGKGSFCSLQLLSFERQLRLCAAMSAEACWTVDSKLCAHGSKSKCSQRAYCSQNPIAVAVTFFSIIFYLGCMWGSGCSKCFL